MIPVIGPLEVVADGPRQLVAQYRNGQDFPDGLPRSLTTEVQPGLLPGAVHGEHGPLPDGVFLLAVPDAPGQLVIVQNDGLGKTLDGAVAVPGQLGKVDPDLGAGVDQLEIRK